MINSSYNFIQNNLIRLWTLCFALVYLRIPLAASLEFHALRRYLIILPVLLSFALIGLALARHKKIKTSILTKIFLVNFILTSIYCTILIYSLNYSLIYDILPILAPVILCFFPLIAIDQYEKDPFDLFELFEKVALLAIWVGFFWFAVQGLSKIEADRLAEFLVPFKAQLEAYPNSALYSHRRVGFLFRLEPSALAMLASTVLIYGRLLSEASRKTSHKYFYFLSAFIGLVGILFSTSLTLLAATLGMLGLTTIFVLRRHRIKIILAASLAFIALLLLYSRILCSFIPRILYYIDNYGKYSSKFFFEFDCNFQSFFMRFEPVDTLTNKCIANEMLFFDTLSIHGLLNVMTWFIFAGVAIYLAIWSVLTMRRNLIPLSFFAFSFMIPAFHMSGVENWGNNYIFVLATYTLFKLYQATPARTKGPAL